MATIINTPAQTKDEGNWLMVLMGLILLAAIIFLLFIYGLPLINESTGQPGLNVPGQIDINLRQGEGR